MSSGSRTRSTREAALSRRDLLRGLGAGALALSPFVRMLRAEAAGPVGNFLYIHIPNGVARSRYTFEQSLKPLAAHRAHVSILTGLRCDQKSAKASHEDITRVLTCVSGSDTSRGYGTSIDWSIANAIGGRPLTTAVAMEEKAEWNTKLSWSKAGTLDQHMADPKKIFAEAFAGFVATTPGAGTTPPPAVIDELALRRQSVFDWVKDDIATLSGRLSGGERSKLDSHLTQVREVERRLGVGAPTTTPMSGTTPTPGTPSICNRAEVEKLLASAPGPEDLERGGNMVIDIIGAAFGCGSRRVATMLYQKASDGINPIKGAKGSHHSVTHYENGATMDDIAKIDTWYAGRLAAHLDCYQQLGLLDRTAIVVGSEVSGDHNLVEMKWLVAGGTALGLKVGKDIMANKNLSDVWVSIQKAVGVNSNTFGQGSTGGIPELF